MQNRNTKQLLHTYPELAERIFKAFSDFKLVAQIREEIEKVLQIATMDITT